MGIYAFIFFIVVVLLDLYIYYGLKDRLFTKKWHSAVFGVLSIFTLSVFLYYYFSGKQSIYYSYKIFIFGIAQSLFFSKIILLPFLFISDIGKLAERIFRKITSSTLSITPKKYWFFKIGVLISILFFGTLIYGIAYGAYSIEKKYISVEISDLPESLEGLKIVQVSDIHLGSFSSTKHIEKAVKLINQEQADIFAFTGDLVNDKSSEILPYLDILKQIRVKYRKYSVLGNHDYSPYITWDSEDAKRQNFQDLLKYQEEIGWKLLNNTHEILQIKDQQLAVLGVEYWGKTIRWGQYGDVNKALNGTDSADLKILLSHDPSHWDLLVSQDTTYKDIVLTLSGHTHGFQFGIDWPSLKWSPSQWVYSKWIGLYQSDQQFLYVNEGLGFLGYPGRVGIAPEITIITLNKKKSNF